MSRSHTIGPIAACLLLACCPTLSAKDAATSSPFIRIQRNDAKQAQSLDTSVVRYAAKDAAHPTTVDLVGAVHIAEPTYFDELNRLFKDYDAVLYELVAPPNAVPKPGQRSAHPVSFMQVTMKNMLELEFQLDRIDYQKPNMVHADLSPDEFNKSMANRNDSMAKLFFRLIGQGIAQQSTDPGRTQDAAMLGALFSRNRSNDLKRIMAEQFQDMEKANAAVDGPNGSTIITDRNKRAIEVLDKQVQAGKKKLAIFYGAAHLPDFDKRLREQFQLEPRETRWLEAWNLRDKPAKARP